MPQTANHSEYVIHSDDEPRRLDRQAAMYGTEDDLRFAALPEVADVLDAGCGSGSAARLFASSRPRCSVVGLDRNAQYLDYASRQAVASGLSNVRFQQGDVLALPFEDSSFDVVWSKHLLQWVRERENAIAEFVRVTRPGGRIVACNFDGFCLQHHPVDPIVQADVEAWFTATQRELGFDNMLGRKLPAMFKAAGLQNVTVDIIADKAFSGFGGGAERAWNWEMQWRSAFQFSVKVFGSAEGAEAATQRLLRRFNDPDVYLYTTLFYVQGQVPVN